MILKQHEEVRGAFAIDGFSFARRGAEPRHRVRRR